MKKNIYKLSFNYCFHIRVKFGLCSSCPTKVYYQLYVDLYGCESWSIVLGEEH